MMSVPDLRVQKDGDRHFVEVFTPLGQYVMRTVVEHYNTQSYWYLTDEELDHLEVSAYSNRATIDRD